MATPIKETPILTGKEAKRFDDMMKQNENKKVPAEEYQRAVKNYQKFELVTERNHV